MNDKENLMNGYPPGGQGYAIQPYMVYGSGINPQSMHSHSLNSGISTPAHVNPTLGYHQTPSQSMFNSNSRYLGPQKGLGMPYAGGNVNQLNSALNEGRNQHISSSINPGMMSNGNHSVLPVSSMLSQKMASLVITSRATLTPFAAAKQSTRTSYREDAEQWTILDMTGMRLKSLSPQLFQYSFLTVLHLAHNYLTYLPPEISQLKALTKLDISGNAINMLPPELGLLVNLKELLLFDNSLVHLPGGLGSLYRLETLGLEGNPMNETIKMKLHKDGAAGVISFLRDTYDDHELPPPRRWEAIERDSKDDSEKLRVMSYNVLCEKYATPQQYGYTPSWALDWSYRKERILNEITQHSSDIICLQEIEAGQYETTFKPILQKSGYDGVFWCKTRAKTMPEKDRSSVDGCATFFKTSKLELIESRIVEFNAVVGREEFKSQDTFNRLMNKDNVAGLVLFETVEKKTRLLVANAHVHWDPEYADVKLVQVAVLTKEMEAIVEQHTKKLQTSAKDHPLPNHQRLPVLLAGDFNSLPDSGVYKFLEDGTIGPDHVDLKGRSYGTFTKNGVSHNLFLKSSCNMIFTNFTPTFTGTIDYIWYTPSCLTITQVLGGVDESYTSKYVGFPNVHFPSDHIPLLIEIKLKAKSKTSSKPQFASYNAGGRSAASYAPLTGSGPSTQSFNQKKGSAPSSHPGRGSK
ncbi:Glucose-repressible alcohol dehydrogenase transcriptional effector [Entomophthora muscae]|uniref:Glucose-repressible alcohol dehydrogenase transcriptional effector n=1 Tax=Entomophthora muscae TaxID=34485 RepID=A0ACC2SFW1_9FUNG|nr:Glucose-repressible alcohol dehydrogenase transcriptional effector [Entomophthora muscae]